MKYMLIVHILGSIVVAIDLIKVNQLSSLETLSE